jgi:hypothetical protein
MGTMMITVALLMQPADSVTVPGVVVDPAGKPVSDVEVVLAGRRPADESVPTLARTTTDAQETLSEIRISLRFPRGFRGKFLISDKVYCPGRYLPGTLRPPGGRRIRRAGWDIPLESPDHLRLDDRSGQGEC